MEKFPNKLEKNFYRKDERKYNDFCIQNQFVKIKTQKVTEFKK